MMRRVLSLLLILLTLPAAAAIVPGPEKPASLPVAAPTPGGETPVAVASDGTDYVVLWSRGVWTESAQLYAAKVTETGIVSPKPSRNIAGGGVEFATLAWTGDAYLAMWTAQSTVMAARLDRDANLLGEPFPVTFGTVHALAWDGRRAVAVANDNLGMKILVLGPAGDLVRTVRVPERVAGDVRVVAAGASFVVVWTANFADGVATIYAMKLSRDGELLTKVKFPFPSSSGVHLDAEGKGAEVGIAYTQWPAPAWTALRPLRRFTLNAHTMQFTQHETIEAALGPEVVAAPGGFVSTVISDHGTRATLDAIPFESTEPRSTELASADAQRPLTASNGRSVLAVWWEGSISGAIFDPSLTRRETPVFAVSTSFIAQRMPEIAPAGDVALHVWTEQTTSGNQLVAARMDRDGNALDAPRLVHADDEWIGRGYDAVFGGRVWLVAHLATGSGQIPHTVVRRVGVDGVPRNEPPVDLGEAAGNPSLASNGNVTLLALETGRGLYVHRFFDGGMELDPTAVIVPAASGPLTLASNGREFLAVDSSLGGRRFDADGRVIDTVPFPIVQSLPWPSSVSVASDGTDYFVAYEHGPEIRVKRVLRTGTPAEETYVGRGVLPRIAVVEGRVMVAYTSAPGLHPFQLYLAEAGREVRPLARSFHYLDHALEGRWLSYTRFPDPQEGISRIFVRTLENEAPLRRRPSRR